jgi:hypothetical protein
MVVQSLTDIKNNFVRSYPEKRTKGKIGKEGAQNAREHFSFQNLYEQMQVDPSKQQNQKKSSKGEFWSFFAYLPKAIAHQMDWL